MVHPKSIYARSDTEYDSMTIVGCERVEKKYQNIGAFPL